MQSSDSQNYVTLISSSLSLSIARNKLFYFFCTLLLILLSHQKMKAFSFLFVFFSFQDIFLCCPNVKKLTICKCDRLDDIIICDLLQTKPLQKCEVLCLLQAPNLTIDIARILGAKYLFFFSSRSLKMREKYISFQFLNDKIHNYGFF